MEDTHSQAGKIRHPTDRTLIQRRIRRTRRRRATTPIELSQKLAEYENKLGEMREVLLRERAEIENQRKRLQRDLEQARKFANERLLGDLLPVCDSLERGLAVENADIAALARGHGPDAQGAAQGGRRQRAQGRSIRSASRSIRNCIRR